MQNKSSLVPEGQEEVTKLMEPYTRHQLTNGDVSSGPRHVIKLLCVVCLYGCNCAQSGLGAIMEAALSCRFSLRAGSYKSECVCNSCLWPEGWRWAVSTSHMRTLLTSLQMIWQSTLQPRGTESPVLMQSSTGRKDPPNLLFTTAFFFPNCYSPPRWNYNFHHLQQHMLYTLVEDGSCSAHTALNSLWWIQHPQW